MGGFVISGDLKATISRLNIAKENSVKYLVFNRHKLITILAPKFTWRRKSHVCGIPYLGNSSLLCVVLAFLCSQGGVGGTLLCIQLNIAESFSFF